MTSTENSTPSARRGALSSTWKATIALVAPALLALVAHAATLRNGFVYDDAGIVARLEQLQSEVSPAFVLQPRGVTYAVHLLDYRLWGPWAPGFHLTNVLLQAVASTLAAYVALTLTGRARLGLLCGLLFAVHPVHVEAVSSFANRKDILAAIFGFLAITLWVKARRPWLRYAGTIACLGIALLSKEVAGIAFFALLFLIDLMLGQPTTKGWHEPLRAASRRFAPLALLAFLAALRFTGKVSGYFSTAHIQYLFERRIADAGQVFRTSLASVPEAFRLLFWPATLSADYPLAPPAHSGDIRVMAGGAILLCGLAAVLGLRRRAPIAAFAIAWSMISYLPTSNIVPLTKFFVAERYLYLPSFGVCLLGALVLDRILVWSRHQRRPTVRLAATAVPVVVIILLTSRTVARTLDWYSDYTLWASSVRGGVHSALVHGNLGVALEERGQWQEAIKQYRAALRIYPRMADTHYNLGVALSKQGQRAEARESLSRAIEISPRYADAHFVLGTLLLQERDLAAAIVHLEQAVALQPDHAQAHGFLGRALALTGEIERSVVHLEQYVGAGEQWAELDETLADGLARQGRIDEAIRSYREVLAAEPSRPTAQLKLGILLAQRGEYDQASAALRKAVALDPGNAMVHFNLGTLLARQEDFHAAIVEFREAIRLDPTSVGAQVNLANSLLSLGQFEETIREYRRALELEQDPQIMNSLAWVLATCPESSRRDGAEAVRLAEQAGEVGDDNPGFLLTLAAAHVENGDFASAVREAERALELARSTGQERLAEKARRILGLARAGRRYPTTS